MTQHSLDRVVIQDEFAPDSVESGGPPAPNPLLKLHGYLRGKYLYASILGTVLAIAGATAAWTFTPVKYPAVGQIRIKSSTIPLLHQTPETNIANYDAFMDSQIRQLTSQRVIQKAMESRTWKAADPDGHVSLIDFMDALLVFQPPGSEYIIVKYLDVDADRSLAAVNSLMDAYKDISDDVGKNSFNGRVEALDLRRKNLTAELRGYTDQILEIAKDVGSDDLGTTYSGKLDRLNKLDDDLQSANVLLAYAKAMRGNAAAAAASQAATATSAPKPDTKTAELTVEDAARIDPDIRNLVNQRQDAARAIELLRNRGFGPTHPEVLRNTSLIRTLDDAIKQRMKDVRKAVQSGTPLASSSGGDGNTEAFIRQAESRVAELTALREPLRNDVLEIGRKQLQISNLKAEVRRTEGLLDEVKTNIDRLNTENQYARRIDPPTVEKALRPDKDRRKPATAAAAFGGFALSFALFGLIGFFDRRLKTVADARDSLDRSNRILGILPYLPEDLSEPAQSETAAFCVHHIRTLLQIGGGSTDSKVFAVTSASPGDGKTSLVISLGLSYAASGAKTLLIDSDLIGAGLTTRANAITRRKIGSILVRDKRITQKQLDDALELSVRLGKRLGETLVGQGFLSQVELDKALSTQRESSLGLLDVLDGEPLEDCIIPGWADKLAILPVGSVGEAHAGQISLRSVRRIIAAARSSYDVILIDTGPILGSLEACIIAASVDEVIVTVARGQHRPLVEKTFARLREIGARIAGIVFNRAHREDIELGGYMSSVSNRLQSPAVREHGDAEGRMKRLGPVARAVADTGTEKARPGGESQ